MFCNTKDQFLKIFHPINFCLFGFHVMSVSNLWIQVPYLLWFWGSIPAQTCECDDLHDPFDLWSFKNSAAESLDSPGHVSIQVLIVFKTNISDKKRASRMSQISIHMLSLAQCFIRMCSTNCHMLQAILSVHKYFVWSSVVSISKDHLLRLLQVWVKLTRKCRSQILSR